MRVSRLMIWAVLSATACPAFSQVFEFETPAEDRWFYPFNFTGGVRPEGSLFAAIGFEEPFAAGPDSWYFNDRDGQIVVLWDTSALITPGQGPQTYDLTTVTVTMTVPASPQVIPTWPVDLTVDPWFTFDIDGDGLVNADGADRGAAGDSDGESSDPDPGRTIELFGAGFGPTYTLLSWNEQALFVGADTVANGPRDPYPLAYRANDDGTFDALHTEDNVDGLHNDGLDPAVLSFTPSPWAVGVPLSYTPGAQDTPFDVRFDIDLCASRARVRRYFQDGLDAGRVAIVLTSLKEEVPFGESDPAERPVFVLKEGAAGEFHAPHLSLTLGDPLPDCDDDGLPDACALDGGLAEDCNDNDIPDDCDIADGGSLDEDDNGIPDECLCFGLADCADIDLNGIRDDPCVWWSCTAGVCAGTPVVYADLGGANGACPPDGATDGNDRFHALNCFSNQSTLGVSGYPCAEAPPGALNVDAAGLGAPCTPDGVCDGNDAFAALNAFAGTTTCSCSGPAPQAPRELGSPAEATPADPSILRPVPPSRPARPRHGARSNAGGSKS